MFVCLVGFLPLFCWLLFFCMNCKLSPSGILPGPSFPFLLRGSVAQCLNLESDWVGYRLVTSSVTLFLYCRIGRNSVVGKIQYGNTCHALDPCPIYSSQSMYIYFYFHGYFLPKSSLFLRYQLSYILLQYHLCFSVSVCRASCLFYLTSPFPLNIACPTSASWEWHYHAPS